MNRRGFLSLLGLGVAGVALEQAIPLGRVWSFPKEIIIAPANRLLTIEMITGITLREWQRHYLQAAIEGKSFYRLPRLTQAPRRPFRLSPS